MFAPAKAAGAVSVDPAIGSGAWAAPEGRAAVRKALPASCRHASRRLLPRCAPYCVARRSASSASPDVCRARESRPKTRTRVAAHPPSPDRRDTTHAAAMAQMDCGIWNGTDGLWRSGSTAARLMTAYAMQMEVFRRMHTSGQFVRVQTRIRKPRWRAAIGNVHSDRGHAVTETASDKQGLCHAVHITVRCVR